MSSSRLSLLLILFAAAVLTAGCSPPGAVNEKAVLDSTPHSEPADYAKSADDYNKHMIERYTKEKPKSIPTGKNKKSR